MRAFFCLVLAATLAAPGAADAETLSMHRAKAKSQNSALPARGETMAQVLKKFGAPVQKHPPVGGGSPKQPPITRWDYDGYSVFFETDHVIDTVVKGQPPTVSHRDELTPAASAPVQVEPPPSLPPPIEPPADEPSSPEDEPSPDDEDAPPVENEEPASPDDDTRDAPPPIL